MRKVVINICYGGFGLSKEAAIMYGLKTEKYPENWGIEQEFWHDSDIKRDDPKLIEVVETLREKADGSHARLSIVEIPDDVEWDIFEYDGMEAIVGIIKPQHILYQSKGKKGVDYEDGSN